MNKRIAKKRYKKALEKALEAMKNSVQTGVGVVIINHNYVDKNGKPCEAMESGSRFITLKHPKIQYFRKIKGE